MASVTLVPCGTFSIAASLTRPASEGAVEFDSVLPGNYYAVATARIPSGGGTARIVGGRTAFDVGDSDLDRVVIPMSSAIDIPGQVMIDGILDDTAPGHHPVVTLHNENYRGSDLFVAFREVFASFSTPERFVINDVIEGDYQVDVTDLPSGTYVKSIRFGAAELADGMLHLDPRSTDRIEIILGTSGGALEGIVTDKERRPVVDTAVALVPDVPHGQRTDLYRNVITDESGRFRLQGIAPGNYLVFAWEEIEDRSWLDPSFVARNEATGRRIQITDRSRETVELVAIPFAY